MPAPSSASSSPPQRVAIVGAGPAGCTLATRLAQAGWTVTLCDQHAQTGPVVGESLLPWCGRVLERLGVDMGGFVQKHGAVFAWDAGARRFPFAEAGRPERPFAWEVQREALDARLRAVAFAAGATFRQGRVARIEPGVVHFSDGSSVQADLVVDAAGRGGLLARQLGIRQLDPALRNSAMSAMHRDVRMVDPDQPGDIAICPFGRDAAEGADDGGVAGWFWFIPFTDGTTSVGLVMTPGSGLSGDRWAQALARCPQARARLDGARVVGELRGHSDFTATASRFWGEGWALVGDAAMFLDPVFSSGVLFALEGADRLADALLQPLSERPAALAAWEADIRAASTPMLAAIRNFYAGRFEAVALTPRDRQPDKVRAAILSLLAGDLFWPDQHRGAHRIAPMLDGIASFVAGPGAAPAAG